MTNPRENFRSLEWDEWNISHIAKHKVTRAEVDEAMSRFQYCVPSYKNRFEIMSFTDADRLILISYRRITVRAGCILCVQCPRRLRKGRANLPGMKYRPVKTFRSTYKPHVTDDQLGGYPTEPHGKIPAFANRQEEAHFWDTHDVIDHEPIPYEERSFYVSLGPDTKARFLQFAEDIGEYPFDFAQKWVKERLDSELAKET